MVYKLFSLCTALDHRLLGFRSQVFNKDPKNDIFQTIVNQYTFFAICSFFSFAFTISSDCLCIFLLSSTTSSNHLLFLFSLPGFYFIFPLLLLLLSLLFTSLKYDYSDEFLEPCCKDYANHRQLSRGRTH